MADFFPNVYEKKIRPFGSQQTRFIYANTNNYQAQATLEETQGELTSQVKVHDKRKIMKGTTS